MVGKGSQFHVSMHMMIAEFRVRGQVPPSRNTKTMAAKRPLKRQMQHTIVFALTNVRSGGMRGQS